MVDNVAICPKVLKRIAMYHSAKQMLFLFYCRESGNRTMYLIALCKLVWLLRTIHATECFIRVIVPFTTYRSSLTNWTASTGPDT